MTRRSFPPLITTISVLSTATATETTYTVSALLTDMSPKFQKYSVGGVVKVLLGDGRHTYGQMTGDAEIAFFDARTKDDLTVGDIVSRPVLFRIAIDSYAITKSVWLKIGKAPLSDELKIPQKMYIQDDLRPDQFEIYCAGEIRSASKEECEGLECSLYGLRSKRLTALMTFTTAFRIDG